MTDIFQVDKKFCCAGFQHLVAAAGERGIACLVIDDGERIAFTLQSRGVAFDDEDNLRAFPDAPDIKINISSESGLRFCPFCGRRLQDLIDVHPEEFRDIAEQHKKMRTVDL